MRAVVTIGFLIFVSSAAVAQSTEPTETQKLNKQVVELARQGKLDQAIDLAEKVVKLETKSRSLSPVAFAVLQDNLGRLKQRRVANNEQALENGSISEGETAKIHREIGSDIADVKRAFDDVLEIYRSEIKSDTLHLASVRRAFAGFLAKYGGGADEQEKAVSLYQQALSSYIAISGSKSENSLTTLLEFGKYRFDRAEFEEAWPLVEKYVETVESAYGPKHLWILPGLRFLASLKLTANMESDARRIVDRIAEITGQPEPLDNKIVDISGRSKDSIITFRFGILWSNDRSVSESTSDAVSRDLKGAVSPVPGPMPVFRNQYGYERIIVKVVVDERGKVLEAKASDEDPKKAAIAERSVMKWKFKAFAPNGSAVKMRGVVLYWLEPR